MIVADGKPDGTLFVEALAEVFQRGGLPDWE